MKDNHMPGELTRDGLLILDNQNMVIADLDLADGGEYYPNKYKPYSGTGQGVYAQLLTTAANSYRKHCGDRAVECAEGDLLGECLEAMQEFVDRVERGELEHRYPYSKYKAILAKTKGDK